MSMPPSNNGQVASAFAMLRRSTNGQRSLNGQPQRPWSGQVAIFTARRSRCGTTGTLVPLLHTLLLSHCSVTSRSSQFIGIIAAKQVRATADRCSSSPSHPEQNISKNSRHCQPSEAQSMDASSSENNLLCRASTKRQSEGRKRNATSVASKLHTFLGSTSTFGHLLKLPRQPRCDALLHLAWSPIIGIGSVCRLLLPSIALKSTSMTYNLAVFVQRKDVLGQPDSAERHQSLPPRLNRLDPTHARFVGCYVFFSIFFP